MQSTSIAQHSENIKLTLQPAIRWVVQFGCKNVSLGEQLKSHVLGSEFLFSTLLS